MPTRRHLRVLLPVLALGVASPAFADTTPADAAKLQSELHDWLNALFAPLLPADVQPVSVTPDGDGFRLRVEAPPSLDDNIPPGSAISLKATPTADGMWELDDVALPSPLVITLPPRPQAAPPPGAMQGLPSTPSAPAKPAPAPRVWRLNTAKTTYRGLFDPTLTRPSHFEATSEETTTQHGNVEAHVGKTQSAVDWTPTRDGRLDLVSHSASEAVSERFMQPDGLPGEMTWSHAESHSQISGLSPTRLRAAVQQISQIVDEEKQAPPMPPSRDQSVALFDTLFGVADEATADGDVSDLAMRVRDLAFGADDVHLGATLASVDGQPHIQTRIAVRGLNIASLSPGVWHDLAPHDATLTLGIGGVSKERLRQFLLASLDFPPGPAGVVARHLATAQLMMGGTDFTIDELAFNLGDTRLEGHGQVHTQPGGPGPGGPGALVGSADIEATDLDKLVARATQEPQLASAAPFLIIARGLAKQDGDKMRWHIEVANNTVTVNGTDLRALMQPSRGPRPAPAPLPPARP
jgi:hypothetical protein